MDAATRTRDDRASVDKALSLLVAFRAQTQTGVGVSELARRSGMSKSTAHRILGMLERNRAVERAGTAYRLGPVFAEIGARVDSPIHDALRDLLTPYLADLYQATHQTVHLAALHGTDVVYLNKLHGHRSVRSPSRIGGRIPAYCTAVGKVLLAHDAGAMDATLAGPLSQWTARTIVDPELLARELETVRERGVAVDRGELLEDLHCIAGPVMGPRGRPVAAFSVSCPAGADPTKYAVELRRLCYAASRALQTSRTLAEAR
ncbi:MAG: IclR family transcriptional regulator [Microbacterium sp.]|uniref:IclR family transcriptional regulator n=1 Tax=Microbacterium sp. TaxID=51671 RepID=UPI003F7D4855